MFSISTLLSLLGDIPAAIEGADKIIADINKLAQTDEVKQIEALLAKVFTVVTTPGSAAIVEPVVFSTANKR